MEEYGFGALPSPKDIRDYHLSAAALTLVELPESYMLKPARIKCQGAQSTCVAHALSSLVEYYNLRDSGFNYVFSTDFIYGCRTDDDYLGEGMYLRDGLKVIQKYGDVRHSQLPGNTDVPTARKKVFADFDNLTKLASSNRISTYYRVYSLDELKYAILTGGPAPASMRWFKSAIVKADGVYHYTDTEIQSHHAILVIGWTKDYLIIQNSWGRTWGKNGLFYVPINKVDEVFCEFYGVTDNINDIIKPSPTVNKFSSLINYILRLINMIREVLC